MWVHKHSNPCWLITLFSHWSFQSVHLRLFWCNNRLKFSWSWWITLNYFFFGLCMSSSECPRFSRCNECQDLVMYDCAVNLWLPTVLNEWIGILGRELQYIGETGRALRKKLIPNITSCCCLQFAEHLDETDQSGPSDRKTTQDKEISRFQAQKRGVYFHKKMTTGTEHPPNRLWGIPITMFQRSSIILCYLIRKNIRGN